MLANSRAPPNSAAAIDVVIYILLMWSAVALLAGEVTNTVQNFLFTQLIPALVIKAILKKRNSSRIMP
jgi:hypothetical protein